MASLGLYMCLVMACWFFTMVDFTIIVFNPLSNTSFQLPHPSLAPFGRLFAKIVFLKDPSLGEPLEALLLAGYTSMLACPNSNGQSWSNLEPLEKHKYIFS